VADEDRISDIPARRLGLAKLGTNVNSKQTLPRTLGSYNLIRCRVITTKLDFSVFERIVKKKARIFFADLRNAALQGDRRTSLTAEHAETAEIIVMKETSEQSLHPYVVTEASGQH
jgi:hypothetical protein